jgi:hypothetical protein
MVARGRMIGCSLSPEGIAAPVAVWRIAGLMPEVMISDRIDSSDESARTYGRLARWCGYTGAVRSDEKTSG